MKIAILGTRGIPNQYGGFEQFAQYVSVGLLEYGHEVTVYNSHTHPYQKSDYHGVRIVHAYDPEDRIGTAGQFIYDLNCIRHIRKQDYDIILQLGYTSSSIWSRLMPRKSTRIITNMDGLEWKRSKFSKSVQRFLRHAEKLAIKYSEDLVADSIGIQQYLLEKYYKESTYIPYGADEFINPDVSVLTRYGVKPHAYNILIARLEPENNIETILDASLKANNIEPMLVVGKHDRKYGSYLKQKYKQHDQIQFLGGIYDGAVLNNLRYYSCIYFHGHSVGGTNPSLLEAMAASCLICAHENVFNQAILGKDGFYFNDVKDICYLLENVTRSDQSHMIDNNLEKIRTIYNWKNITKSYHELFVRKAD